jgi:molecular chaperone GrpE
MTDGDTDEQILGQFRTWLEQTRREAAQVDDTEASRSATEPRVGLDRLVEEFTALRHEVKLQTRSSRTLEERLEAALRLLGEAAETFRTAPAKTVTAVDKADKSLAAALAELDEALDRGRDQWEKSAPRLIGPPSSALLAEVKANHAKRWWWQRLRTQAYHRQACALVEEREEQARKEREALVGALLGGFVMIQQRLARNMTSAEVNRIPTVGRLVDPDQMIVIEVIDVEGPAGQVVEELRRGYTWRGQVLRPAEVRAIRPRFEAANSNIH